MAKSSSKTDLGIAKSILIAGGPGTGKTSLAVHFPNAMLLNLDNNVEGPIRYLRGTEGGCPDFSYADIMYCEDPDELKAIGMKESDIPPHNDQGIIPVPREWRYRRYADFGSKAISDPSIETIIIDSYTSLNDVIKDEVRRQFNLPFEKGTGIVTKVDKRPEKEGFAMWDGYLALAKHGLMSLKASGKRIIAICHVHNKEVNDVSRQFIAIPGQYGEQISGYFEEVWLIDIDTEMVKGVAKPVRKLRTQATSELIPLGLKSASQLSPIQTLDPDELIKKLTA